ncbi:MAG: ABC transporter permease [Planctomycetes bacterium]|nr:ABC transporter permease [Planctomycetota bacterium]
MNQIRNIIRRELTGYFTSPVAYIFLIIFLMMAGWFTFSLGGFFMARQADLRSFFYWHPWLYLIFLPAIAMRLWSEERKSGTIQLLFTLPITVPQAVIGKFLAAWIFHALALFLTFPMVLTVMYLGDPDKGVILCSYIGSFLMAGSYLAIGSLTSSLTKNQVVSFILAIVTCLVILLAGFNLVTDYLAAWFPVWVVDFIASFGFWSHFESIQRGVIDLADLVYFASVIGLALVLNITALQSRKAV